MKYKVLKRNDAKKLFEEYEQNGLPKQFELSKEYLKMRDDLLELANLKSFNKSELYKFDLDFAINLYDYFNELEDFNETVASNYNFWMYISLKVVPDIVAKRRGFVAEYYYSKNVRIYLATLWWYVHISWQGSIEKTYDCLEKLNTDYILQLVERTGKGIYLEVSRAIIKRICSVSDKERNKRVNDANLMRRVLMLNTAKIENFNLLFENDVDAYVAMLFKECGCE